MLYLAHAHIERDWSHYLLVEGNFMRWLLTAAVMGIFK